MRCKKFYKGPSSEKDNSEIEKLQKRPGSKRFLFNINQRLLINSESMLLIETMESLMKKKNEFYQKVLGVPLSLRVGLLALSCLGLSEISMSQQGNNNNVNDSPGSSKTQPESGKKESPICVEKASPETENPFAAVAPVINEIGIKLKGFIDVVTSTNKKTAYELEVLERDKRISEIKRKFYGSELEFTSVVEHEPLLQKEWELLQKSEEEQSEAILLKDGKWSEKSDVAKLHGQTFQDYLRTSIIAIYHNSSLQNEINMKELKDKLVKDKIKEKGSPLTRQEEEAVVLDAHSIAENVFLTLRTVAEDEYKKLGKKPLKNLDAFLAIALWSQTQTFDLELVNLGRKNFANAPLPVLLGNLPGTRVEFRIRKGKIVIGKAYPNMVRIVSDIIEDVGEVRTERTITFDLIKGTISSMKSEMSKEPVSLVDRMKYLTLPI